LADCFQSFGTGGERPLQAKLNVSFRLTVGNISIPLTGGYGSKANSHDTRHAQIGTKKTRPKARF